MRTIGIFFLINCLFLFNIYFLDSTIPDYRTRLRQEFQDFLRSMLQVCPAMDCSLSCHYQPEPSGSMYQYESGHSEDDLNSVVVDLGQVDEQVATLWWALAQQTARVARRCTGNTTLPVVVDEIRSTTPSGWTGNAWAPVTSLSSRPALSPEPTDSIPCCVGRTVPVQDLTLSRCNSSSSRSSSSSSAGSTTHFSETMSTTPMSSPRLVREICEKFPPANAIQRPASATPTYQTTYVYESPPPNSKNDGVQLLRYVRVSQSSSVDQLPTDGQMRGSIRRPKSDVVARKFSDNSGQQQTNDDNNSSSADCVQYESQDLGRDDDELAAAYSPIVVVVNLLLYKIVYKIFPADNGL